MAMNPLYQNKLNDILNGNFSGTEGGRFLADQGLQAARRGMSSQRGSGNVLAELARLGTGYAAQDRGDEIDRLGRLSGQEQTYDLGLRADALGQGRLGLDTELGRGRLSLDRTNSDRDFGLGMLREGNTAQRNAWDYDIGRRGADSSWANSQTNWFNAQSQDRDRRNSYEQSWWDRVNR